MSTSTSTTTYTYTHTATYLSDVIMGTIGDVLALLGITPNGSARWDQDQAAIAAWIEEQSLDMVVLECRRPDGAVRPIFEFPLSYRAGEGQFENSRAAMARAQAKISSVPPGTTYRLFCTFRKPRTPQPGWSSGVRSSTADLRSTSFGTLADAPHASAGVRYLR
jgi:HORMA domain-containing protein